MVSQSVPQADHGGNDTKTSSFMLISRRTFVPKSITTPEQSRPNTSGNSRCLDFYKKKTKY